MIYIGADHRGYNLKEKIKEWLSEWGFDYEDLGAFKLDPGDDYPIFASAVAEKIEEKGGKGIVICGSGAGVDIVANKFDGVRSVFGINKDQVHVAVSDDDVNVLAIASDFIPENDIKPMIEIFLRTEFSGADRHKRRLEEIKKIENNN